MAVKKIYEGEEYFLLRVGAVEYPIEEPIHWDGILMNGRRDEGFYAFNVDFVEGDTQLIFAYGDGGGDLLESEYKLHAGDAVVQLEFGLVRGVTRDMQYLGNVNLNDFVAGDDGVEATVEKVSFENLFRTRYDTKVTVGAGTNFDGMQMPGIGEIKMLLHSKNLVKITQAKTPVGESFVVDINGSQSAAFDAIKHYIQPDTLDLQPDELDDSGDIYGVYKLPFAITKEHPVDQFRYQYHVLEAGILEIYYGWDVGRNTLLGVDAIFNRPNNTWSMFVIVQRGTDRLETKFPATDPYGLHSPQSNTFTVQVQKDDKIYVGIEVTHTANVRECYADGYFNLLIFKQQTISEQSTCPAYRVFDFLNYLVAAVTNKVGRVLSNYYGPGGAGEKIAVASGYAIRNFNVADDKPVQANLNEVLEGLQTLDNIGVGFKKVYDPIDDELKDYVVIEPMQYWYRGGVIDVITDVSNLTEGHDSERTFNEVTIGYDKFAKEEYNTLDEFNTEQSWLLPIRSYKNPLAKKCSLIASGTLLEMQRREQFKEQASKSLDNDDALFIICYVDNIEFPGVGFDIDALNSTITFSKPVGLVVGDYFGLSTELGTFRADALHFEQPNSYKYTNPMGGGTSGSYNGTLYIELPPGASAAAERNQYFDDVQNVVDAGSVYNLRLSPHRIFYKWAPLLWTSLDKKQRTEFIRNTFSKNNGELISRMSVDAPNPGIVGYRQIIEKSDILLSDFAPETQIMTAGTIQCKAELSYDRVKRIKTALRDEHDDPTINCGTVVLPDRRGELWECHLQSLTYNWVTGEAELIGNKVKVYQ